MKTYRQGDVLIRPIKSIPTGKKQTKKICLALGEVTGHHHSILDTDRAIGYADEENMLCSHVQVEEPVELTHAEHAGIILPTGNYEVILQSEYTPKEIVRVKD